MLSVSEDGVPPVHLLHHLRVHTVFLSAPRSRERDGTQEQREGWEYVDEFENGHLS